MCGCWMMFGYPPSILKCWIVGSSMAKSMCTILSFTGTEGVLDVMNQWFIPMWVVNFHMDYNEQRWGLWLTCPKGRFKSWTMKDGFLSMVRLHGPISMVWLLKKTRLKCLRPLTRCTTHVDQEEWPWTKTWMCWFFFMGSFTVGVLLLGV